MREAASKGDLGEIADDESLAEMRLERQYFHENNISLQESPARYDFVNRQETGCKLAEGCHAFLQCRRGMFHERAQLRGGNTAFGVDEVNGQRFRLVVTQHDA